MTPSLIDKLLDRAFEEDLSGGDLTTEACVLATARARATAVARTPLVVCGGEVFLRAFTRLDPAVETRVHVAEGTSVEKGAVLWEVAGPARALLMAERTARNFVQRLSGGATLSVGAWAFMMCVFAGAYAVAYFVRKLWL